LGPVPNDDLPQLGTEQEETMRSTDRFLIGIVAGILLLVVAAFAVMALRPKPDYRKEDTPEGVAHNYLLALQKEDLARAYSYLSPTIGGYPDSADAFADHVKAGWEFSDLWDGSTTLAVDSARTTGARATVSVRWTHFYEGDLLDSSQYTSYFDIELRSEGETWKIVHADRYWHRCWEDPYGYGCR
jgi:hypothetical protein